MAPGATVRSNVGSYVCCRGPGSCGYQWNPAGAKFCSRCSHGVAGAPDGGSKWPTPAQSVNDGARDGQSNEWKRVGWPTTRGKARLGRGKGAGEGKPEPDAAASKSDAQADKPPSLRTVADRCAKAVAQLRQTLGPEHPLTRAGEMELRQAKATADAARPPQTCRAAEANLKKRQAQRDSAQKAVSELEAKLGEARKAAATADEEVKAAEQAHATAAERERLPETKASAIAKLVENALRRATGCKADGGAGPSSGDGAAANGGGAADSEVPIEEVVGLVKEKVDEILKQLEAEKVARAAERAGTPTGLAAPSATGWFKGTADAADLDADMELPPDQFAAELDRKLAAKREQMVAANAARAKRPKTGP